MADIRKRNGSKGITYQVRYPSKTSRSGYAFKTFPTLKEAREFRESGKTKKLGYARSGGGIITVADGIEKWLEVCEKEGRDGRDPVTDFTLKGYKYRASVIKSYSWEKTLPELTAPDIVEFRSWLLGNYPRSMAHFVLSSFHSMILEMVFRGVLPHDVAARVSIRSTPATRNRSPSPPKRRSWTCSPRPTSWPIQRTVKYSGRGNVIGLSFTWPLTPACGHRNILPWLTLPSGIAACM